MTFDCFKLSAHITMWATFGLNNEGHKYTNLISYIPVYLKNDIMKDSIYGLAVGLGLYVIALHLIVLILKIVG